MNTIYLKDMVRQAEILQGLPKGELNRRFQKRRKELGRKAKN
jgi:hypothetical protein